MKNIYQVIGSDGVVLATVACETEAQGWEVAADFEGADLIFVNDTNLESGLLFELGNDDVGSLTVIAVKTTEEALAIAKAWGTEFGEVYEAKEVGSF